MDDNVYTGREYLSNLKDFQIDVINIGNNSEIDIEEDRRCGSLWNPEKKEELFNFFNFYNFKNLKSKSLINFLKIMT